MKVKKLLSGVLLCVQHWSPHLSIVKFRLCHHACRLQKCSSY